MINEELLTRVLTMLTWFVAMGVVFTVLSRKYPCNPGGRVLYKGWKTDSLYYFLMPFVTRYVGFFYVAIFFGLFFEGYSDDELISYFKNGAGPLGALPIAVQVILILLISDVLLYWIHRSFHGRHMWRFHAVHHSSEDIDWLSAYRFHPINTWLSFTIVDVLMLMIGFSPLAFAILAPFNMMFSGFVHSNVRWSLGPFKYVLASPVFHRWHHTHSHKGGNKNFAPTFPFLDMLFGTFYMPKGELPGDYGVDKRDVPEGFVEQMFYPFKKKR